MSKKAWNIRTADLEKSVHLAVTLGISQLTAQLLVKRGLETEAEARAYLYPTARDLHDPFLLHDMEKAVTRIQTAMKRGERIWIYGDYDTDGTTATALLFSLFRHLDYPASWYIPHRFEEGYGLNKEAIEKLSSDGCNLLITVDCGITAIEEVELANALGVDVIITDHHQLRPDAHPPAYAMITPKVPESQYPFDGLAGVGLAFKLAHALMGGGDLNPFLVSQLDLVALGTVVDIAPLTGENRVLTKLGLVEINKRERPGIRALCKVAGHDENKPLVGHTLSFTLGPRINAAGRMDTARKVVELLTGESYDAALEIANELQQHNQERRDVENRILEQAVDAIRLDYNLDRAKGLVVAREDWHRGVVGIVATRVLERFHRPVFLLAIDGDEAHGSGRGIEGINLAESLDACTDVLVKHGGHAAAAGLTIKTKNIPEFKRRFDEFAGEHLTDEHLTPKLDVDFEVSLSYLTFEALEELQELEPFGHANKKPTLVVRNLSLQAPPRLIGADQNHIRLLVTDGQHKVGAIGWRMADRYTALTNKNIRLDLAFEPEINEYNNIRNVQLKLEDLEIRSLDRREVQAVFPLPDSESCVRVVDRRNTRSKPNYLRNLLTRREPTLLYVRDEKALDQALALVGVSGAIGRCADITPDTEKERLIALLEQGDLVAIASSCTLTRPASVQHIVFCHPLPDATTFFNRCQLAFENQSPTYIHLVYNRDDVERMVRSVFGAYPDEEALRKLYKELQRLVQNNGRKLTRQQIEAAIQDSIVSQEGVSNGLKVFGELGLLTHLADGILFAPPPVQKRPLHASETYLEGEQVKQVCRLFASFQLEQDIQEIWKKIYYEPRMSCQQN